MAGGSIKRTAERNAEALKKLQMGFIGANILHLILRYLFRPRPIFSGASFMFLLTFVPSIFVYQFLVTLGKPQRDSRGFLRPGQDISEAKGPIEWAHDILYIIWGLSVMTPLLGYKFYWFLLVVPGYAGWKVWTTFGPQIKAKAAQVQAEAANRQAGGGGTNANGGGGAAAAEIAAETSRRQEKKKAKQEKLEKAQRNMRR